MSKKVDFKKLSVHEAPERSPGFLLWHVSTMWRSSIETILKPLGLTHPQFVVLATVGWLTRHGDRATQVAIGKMASLDPNTTSQIIRGLEKKDFLKREPSADGRAKNPLLTLRGSAVLRQALPAVEIADAQFFTPLTKKETESTIKIFQKLTID
ncbi:MAG: ydcH [Chlamydiia bacterium]|nr:ydcH [Chlamydiia bacterium]